MAEIDPILLDILWLLLSAGLVFLMQAGYLAVETGLTRSKNNIDVAMKNVVDFGIAFLIFFFMGFALMFGSSGQGWIGSSDFAPDFAELGGHRTAVFLFQAMLCTTAVTIISGAVAERLKFWGYILVTIVVAAMIYPIYGHWAWNDEGWLGDMGFQDFAGSTVVHSIGGWVALALLFVLGPRKGRFPEDGKPEKIFPSNMPMTSLGVILLWVGWMGFNGGNTLALDDTVSKVIANTVLAGMSGLVISIVLAWVITGKADVDCILNGSIAGLVAICASCLYVSSLAAVAIGAVAGVVAFGVRQLLERFHIDDAVGAIPVHLGAGIWGTLAVAFFGDPELLGTDLGLLDQLLAQLGGILVCFLWSFGLTFVIASLINRIAPIRVSPENELIGLNISEHDARTPLLDLFQVMDRQAKTGDLSLRAPEEPFTEVGQIAARYNDAMEKLEKTMGNLETTTSEKARMASELNIACDIQMAMLPLIFPAPPESDNVSIYATLLPAREVGGDFYDFFFIDEDRICFNIGDVSDKGVPAALFMAIAKTLVKSIASNDTSTASIITQLNEVASRENTADMFVTLFLGILNTKTGELLYTNAGHNPPYIMRKDGTIERLEGRHGPVIGAMSDLTYREERKQLEKEDTLILYTDGVTEAKDPRSNLFSERRLVDLLGSRSYESTNDIVHSTVSAVRKYEGTSDQTDDITVLALRFFGPLIEGEMQRFHMTIKNRLPDIKKVQQGFRDFAERHLVPKKVIGKMDIVFDELLNNINSYAYPDKGEHDIEIMSELTELRLMVTIIDDGVPFNPLRLRTPDIYQSMETRRIGGLGIHMVRRIMDQISYKRRIDCNVVTLIKFITGRTTPAV